MMMTTLRVVRVGGLKRRVSRTHICSHIINNSIQLRYFKTKDGGTRSPVKGWGRRSSKKKTVRVNTGRKREHIITKKKHERMIEKRVEKATKKETHLILKPQSLYESPLSKYAHNYIHDGGNTSVKTLYGNSEGNAFWGLTGLTGINLFVFWLWNKNDDDEHQDFMRRHFCTNLTNLKEGRIHTLLTCSFSHSSTMHIFGNMFSMWLFGFKPYRVLGISPITGFPGFLTLYTFGSMACATSHCASNLFTGRTEKPLQSCEIKWIRSHQEEVQNSPSIMKILKRQDTPSLGASGSVMAIIAVSAALFPKDKIFIWGTYMPILAAALFYVGWDTLNVVNHDGVDHVGHLGGIAAGAGFITYVWKNHGRRAGPLPLIAVLRELYRKNVVKNK